MLFNTSLQQVLTTLLYNTSLQHVFSTRLYNTSQHFSTALPFNKSLQHFLQHVFTTLPYNTSLQHVFSTLSTTTLPFNTFPECVAKGSRLTWESEGRAVFAGRCFRDRNRSQPFATVLKCSNPAPMALPLGRALKSDFSWMCHVSVCAAIVL